MLLQRGSTFCQNDQKKTNKQKKKSITCITYFPEAKQYQTDLRFHLVSTWVPGAHTEIRLLSDHCHTLNKLYSRLYTVSSISVHVAPVGAQFSAGRQNSVQISQNRHCLDSCLHFQTGRKQPYSAVTLYPRIGDAYAFTFVSNAVTVSPRPPSGELWQIGSQFILKTFRSYSHLYFNVDKCDSIAI